MAKISRKAVFKRRSIEGGKVTDPNRLTMAQALGRVMSIYSAEGYRKRTMDDYTMFWKEFTRVVDLPIYVDEVEPEHFRSYINILLRKRGLSPVTVNIRMNALRAMFNRLYKEGVLGEENPVANIRKLRTDESSISALSDEQVRAIFEQIDLDSFAGYRDYCALLTMLRCGLRMNEINSLEEGDIDFEAQVMFLPGIKNKNRKNRIVPMPDQVAQELAQLIEEQNAYFGANCPYVFRNNKGGKMEEHRIRRRLHEYGVKAGLKGVCKFSPHTFRHTFAVRFLKNGGDIRTLMAILGHSSIETTQVYLTYTDNDVVEGFRKISDKDDLIL